MSALLIGYAHCSTDQQDLTAQRDALSSLGVEPSGSTSTTAPPSTRRRGRFTMYRCNLPIMADFGTELATAGGRNGLELLSERRPTSTWPAPGLSLLERRGGPGRSLLSRECSQGRVLAMPSRAQQGQQGQGRV